MKLNLALAAALSLANNNIVSVSADTLAAEEIEELNTLFAEEIHLEEQNEEILDELNSLTQTRFDIGGGEEEEEGEMVAQSDTLEGEEGGDIVLNFDAPDLRVEDEEGEGYDELPDDGIAYTTSAMEEDNSSDEEEAVHVPTKHELHHAAKIAAKANKHHDMLSKAHSMKSVEKKHSKAAKATHHGSKGSKRGKMGKAHLSMPTHSGKANKMTEPIHHEAKTHKTPSATVKSTSQSASSSSKANKATTDVSTEEAMPVPMPVEEETSGDDDVTELNMEPVPRTPDVSPAHQGVDTSELNGRLKQEMAEVMLGDTSHVGKGHSQSNENVAALDLLRAKSDAAAQSSGGSVVGRSVGIVGGVCLVGSILYGMTMV